MSSCKKLLILILAVLYFSCHEDIADLPSNHFENDQGITYFTFTDWEYDGWTLKVYFESNAPAPTDSNGEPLNIAVIRDNMYWFSLSHDARSFSTSTFYAPERTCYQLGYTNSDKELSRLNISLCLGG